MPSSHKYKRKLKKERESQGEKCPAWGETCDNCKGAQSFPNARKCTKFHSPTHDSNNDYDDQRLMAVNHSKDSITATLRVNENDARFQLDRPADVNTTCQKHVRKHQVSPTSERLKMENKTNFKPFGETFQRITNSRTGTYSAMTEVKFIVVPNGFTNLLGLKTIQELGFITINKEWFISQTTSPLLGDLGEVTLKIDENIPPKVLLCRNVPLAIQNAVTKELNQLVKKAVLSPVTEPTEWAVVHKPNGTLRISIDPQPLNAALKHEHCRLPVLDDVLPKLRDAKVFRKLDLKEAFWHVRL